MENETSDDKLRFDPKEVEDTEILIKSAEIDIKEAEKTGADLSEAKRYLEEAETYLKNLNIKEARISVKKVKTAAADSKRYHRAELLIQHALPVIESARKAGADSSKAEAFIEKAKEALNMRMYGDLSEYVRSAKQAAQEAKRYHRASLLILNCGTDVANAKMAGADVTEAERFLTEAQSALENKDYGVVAQLVKNAKYAAMKLEKFKMVEDLIDGVKPDVEELQRFGMRTEETEELIREAEEALDRRDYAEVRSLVRKIKRRIKKAMERKGSNVLIATIEHVIHKARASGMDVSHAKMLLDKAESALENMSHAEIEQIISETNSIARDMNIPVGTLAGDLFSKAKLVDLDKIDVVFSDAEKKISMEMARARITAMRDLLTSARELGLDETEFVSLLRKAELAFESKQYDAIEEYKEIFDETLDEAKIKHKIDFIGRNIKNVATMISRFKEQGIDVGNPEKLIIQAENELKAHNFEKAEMNVELAKKLTINLGQRHDTQKELVSVKDTLSEAKAAGVELEEANDLLDQAENEMNASNFGKAIELIEKARNITSGSVQHYIQDKYPKLTLKLPEGGMENDVWNKCVIEIANIGDLIAKNVDMTFEGNVDVKGVERIEKLDVGEKRRMEIGVKPKEAGDISFDVLLAYQRAFDDTIYQLDLAKQIIVDTTGTYSIEDVLLIHNSGVLITQASRKMQDDLDQDIFSAMFTAVQQFIRDSFREREDTGLKRLDFSTNKILIEHGHFAFLTAIIIGGEPRYLPLYMMEVIKEVEQKYGEVLDGWRGGYSELEGIDEIIAKLLNVTEDKGAEVEGFESGLVAPTIKLIEAAEEAGAKTGTKEKFIGEFVETMEKQGFDHAWSYLESIGEETEKEISSETAKQKLQAMKELMTSAKELGMDGSEFLSVLDRAEKAFANEDFDIIHEYEREFEEKLKEAKTKHKVEIIQKRIEKGKETVSKFRERGVNVDEPEKLLIQAEEELKAHEIEEAEKDVKEAEKVLDELHRKQDILRDLESVKDTLPEARALGIDVQEADNLLTQAEHELKANNFEGAKDLMERAKSIILSRRRRHDLEYELESVKKTSQEAKTSGVDVIEANKLLTQAEGELNIGNFGKCKELIEKARKTISSTVEDYIKGKFPKLMLTLTGKGMEANAWNKSIMEISNTGDLLAKNVDITLEGEMEVKGTRRIEELGIGERKRMEIGLKPKEVGELALEILLTYQRAFDDTIFQLDTPKRFTVDASGTYLIEDVFLILNNGLLVSQVSRKLEEDIDRDIFSGMLTAVQEFVHDSFQRRGDVGLKRMDFGTHKILLEQGSYTFLVSVLIGGEPQYLPLYMMEVIKEVEQKYGTVLDGWDGTYTQLEGLKDVLAKLMEVTDEKGADVEGFESGTVSATIKLIEAAREAGVELGGPDAFVKELIETMEKEGFDQAWSNLKKMGEDVEKSRAELKHKKEGMEELKHAFLRDMDEHLIREIGDSLDNYLRIADEIIEVISKIRQEEEIKDTTPIKKVAIKSSDEAVRDAIAKLKSPFLEKVNAKNLEVVEPGTEWEGLNLEVIPNRDVINTAYKQQASKVETLLKYQSPWKIKRGIEKVGEYTLGVEGYPVKITPKMLNFKISTPESVIVKEHDGTIIYIDKELTQEMKTEGIVEELIEHINNMRKELNIKEEDYIETQVVVEDKTAEFLEKSKERIASKTLSYAVEFPFDNIFESGDSGYFVVEKELDGKKVIIGIVVVEWEEG